MFATCPVSLMPIFKGILPLLSGPQATYFFNLNVYDVLFFTISLGRIPNVNSGINFLKNEPFKGKSERKEGREIISCL